MMKFFYYIAIVVVLFSCTKDDDNSITSVTNVLSSGTWKIEYFRDSGMVQTSSFAPYDLSFSAGQANTVIASDSSTTLTGAWAVTYAGQDASLSFDFGSDSLFGKLNETWLVNNLNDSLIRLSRDVNDSLAFRKL